MIYKKSREILKKSEKYFQSANLALKVSRKEDSNALSEHQQRNKCQYEINIHM